MFQAQEEVRRSVTVSTDDVDEPAADTAAVATYAAAGSYYHIIGGVAWSYSGAPTGGNLKIEDGTDTIFSVDITAAGHNSISFGRGKRGTRGNALVITLAAGGGAVVGKVNATWHLAVKAT